VNRIRSPIESVIFSRSNTLNFRAWSSGNCFSTPSLPTMTAHSSRSSNLFQVLANLAMEPPPRTDSESIRNEKVKVLKAIPPLESNKLVRGQFRGYRNEQGVAPDSQVETFAALQLEIDSWRWKGVPFYIRA
jgi:glucose-6-phosphate 1-dehydrogenase